jgi:SAM-dependent methyltransferase
MRLMPKRLDMRARRAAWNFLSARDGDSQWLRTVMNRDLDRRITQLNPSHQDAVEVSGHMHGGRAWRSYTTLDFPAFDLCTSEPADQFDVVLCEQVLEHVPDPLSAVKNLFRLCRPGGTLLVSTPFLVRVHPIPEDYWRFTEAGLTRLLEWGGFERVDVASWGNRRCVNANAKLWARKQPWHSLRNEPELPVVVWASARRPCA